MYIKKDANESKNAGSWKVSLTLSTSVTGFIVSNCDTATHKALQKQIYQCNLQCDEVTIPLN